MVGKVDKETQETGRAAVIEALDALFNRGMEKEKDIEKVEVRQGAGRLQAQGSHSRVIGFPCGLGSSGKS